MKYCLITGGTGFIGHWLRRYCPSDIEITAKNEYEYKFARWDMHKWDYIIHLAPVPVDAAMNHIYKKRGRLLFASSGGVYDINPDKYFSMKLEDERKLLASGLDVRIARIFTTCGTEMKWKRYAIGNFIMQAYYTRAIEVQSGGLVVRSYMYGSDLAEWLWAILLHGEPGGIYNVGSDVPHSTAELAFEVANNFEPRPQINIIPRLQYEPRPYYVPDTSRAREELGLTIKVPFEEAVRHTVEDYKNAQ